MSEPQTSELERLAREFRRVSDLLLDGRIIPARKLADSAVAALLRLERDVDEPPRYMTHRGQRKR